MQIKIYIEVFVMLICSNVMVFYYVGCIFRYQYMYIKAILYFPIALSSEITLFAIAAVTISAKSYLVCRFSSQLYHLCYSRLSLLATDNNDNYYEMVIFAYDISM